MLVSFTKSKIEILRHLNFKIMKHLNYLVLALALMMFGCDNSDEANDPKLEVVFSTTGGSNANQRTSNANGLDFTEGTIRLKEVKFEYESDNDSVEFEYDLDQTVLIDYATGATTPDISAITIPAGTYNEVEFEFELEPLDSEPAIVVNGTFTYSGETTPVRFEFNYEDTFELSYEGNFTLGTDVTAVAEIVLDANAWFVTVTAEELAAADINDNGVIVISKDVNRDIFDTASDGLELATDVKIEF